MKRIALGVALTAAAIGAAPHAHADMLIGNYELQIPDRYDFHTWVWQVSPCPTKACVQVDAIPRPNAKGEPYNGLAQLANGRYTLTVDDPFGLRCGGVYYGPVVATHDVYSWDAASLAGALESSFDTDCGGGPGGTNTYPFTLSRM